MALPTNVDTGRVEGRFIVGVADGPDQDLDPDGIPAQGTVTFTASVPYLPDPFASPAPVTILKAPIIGVLDSEGYLCTPDPADATQPGYRGVRLIATDDPDLSVTGWTWTVTYNFQRVAGAGLSIPSHSMALPTGATVDLTTVVKVPSSNGIGIEQAEALAAAAQSSATVAAQSAAAAQTAAQAAQDAAEATDTGVAALVTTGPATTAALDRSYRRGISVTEYGAAGNGAVDDTAAIQAAADAAAQTADAALYFPAGRYRTSGTVYIQSTLYASEAQLDYYGTGTALVVGVDPATPATTARRSFDLPRVRNRLRTGSAWDGTSTGVRLVNLNTCQIKVPFIQDFENGLVFEGADRGCAYNTVILGAIWECHTGISYPTTGAGYCTQNIVIGGRLQLSFNKNQVTDDPTARQVLLSGNNHTFIGTSFETDGVPLYIADISGSYHQLINCRWESQNGAVPRVIYRSDALSNLIRGGYEARRIEETFEGTNGGGEIFDGAGGYSRATLGDAQTFPSGSTRSTILWGAHVGRRVTQNIEQGRFTPRPGRWRVNGQVTFAPNPTGRRVAFLIAGTAGASFVMAAVEVPPSQNRTAIPLSGTRSFNGLTSVWVEVMQTSGEPLGLETAGGYNFIELEYLGN